MAYALVDTPVGQVVAARPGAASRACPTLDFHGNLDTVVERLSAGLSPRILEAPARLDDGPPRARRVLRGPPPRLRPEGRPVADQTPFAKRLLEATARIPFGETRTYRDMAAAAGNAAAVRAAGNALGHNPIPIVVPCHRVLRTGGNIGGYTGGLDRKVKLLATEGIEL